MSWNHRVIKHKERNPLHDKDPKNIPEFEEWYGIHEVYYMDKNDPDKPTSSTKDEIVMGNDIEELRWQLQKMLECLDKPVLDDEYNEI